MLGKPNTLPCALAMALPQPTTGLMSQDTW
jgi:hypothetical protein